MACIVERGLLIVVLGGEDQTEIAATRGRSLALPNLYIAGTGRAGTTALFRYLADHPRVCASSVKEVHFFDRVRVEDLDDEQIEKYAAHFSHCSTEATIRMEATPTYLYGGKAAAEAIRSITPDAKLIFSLREPVSRAFTVYRANKIREPDVFGDLSFDDFVTIGLEYRSGGRTDAHPRAEMIAGRLEQGCYAGFLSAYYAAFAPEQICVLFFDDLASDVRSVVYRVAEFLGIDRHFYDSYVFSVENRTRSYRFPLLHRVAFETNLKLERTLNRYPAVRRRLREIYNMLNEHKGNSETVSEWARERLCQFYESHNRDLFLLLKPYVPKERMPRWVRGGRDV